MSAPHEQSHGHAEAGHGHDEHGHSGPDPMKVKMGAMLGLIAFVVIFVTVFSYASLPANAQIFRSSTARNPIILPVQSVGLIPNACDTLISQYFDVGSKKCR